VANAITAFRLLLLFLFVALVYTVPPPWQFANLILLTIIFALDGLDGFVARIRGEASTFGAVFDIAADRIVENVLWLVLAERGLVPVWVPIVFLTRGFLVDSLRAHQTDVAPFDTARTRLGLFLVKSRFMRFNYALLKLLAFGWLFLLYAFASDYPSIWQAQQSWMLPIGDVLVYITVAFCIVRALPTLLEPIAAQMALRRPGQRHGTRSHRRRRHAH
jgi:CDP-diacylglycerol--glycerol-3-phosphate 3-phosphatidyltransferase